MKRNSVHTRVDGDTLVITHPDSGRKVTIELAEGEGQRLTDRGDLHVMGELAEMAWSMLDGADGMIAAPYSGAVCHINRGFETAARTAREVMVEAGVDPSGDVNDGLPYELDSGLRAVLGMRSGLVMRFHGAPSVFQSRSPGDRFFEDLSALFEEDRTFGAVPASPAPTVRFPGPAHSGRVGKRPPDDPDRPILAPWE